MKILSEHSLLKESTWPNTGISSLGEAILDKRFNTQVCCSSYSLLSFTVLILSYVTRGSPMDFLGKGDTLIDIYTNS